MGEGPWKYFAMTGKMGRGSEVRILSSHNITLLLNVKLFKHNSKAIVNLLNCKDDLHNILGNLALTFKISITVISSYLVF
jgi:hypothetical protein